MRKWLLFLLASVFLSLPAWALDAPASLTVPASDPDGGFSVSWTAVPGTGVSYELQQATDAAFTTDLQSVFTGTKTKVSLKGRTAGETYYYRVKSMAGGDESVWVAAANGCDVPYRVSTKANAGGTINPPPGLVTIPVGTTQAVTITPNTGFHIVSVVVDGVVKVDAKAETVAPYSHTTAYTVNVPADLVDNPKNKHKIAAKFKANSYEVTATAGAGGKITPVGTKKKKHGKQATYTVTASSGKEIASVAVNGVAQPGFPKKGPHKLSLTVTEETTIEALFQDSGSVGVDMSKGGVVEVTDTNSPIYGAKVTLEGDGLSSSNESVTISYQDSVPGTFSADAQNNEVEQASKTIVITRTGAGDLTYPALVKIPYDKSLIGSNDVPVVLYWNQATGKYSAVAIEEIDRQNGFITFKTAHMSPFVVVKLKKVMQQVGSSLVPAVDTGFRPEVDGFFHRNFGAYDSPGGSCFGMANYSGWYYSNKKATDGDPLYTSYREGDTNKQEDDQNARELISRAFMASSQYWGKKALAMQGAAGELFTGLYMLQAMIITGEPQTLLMSDDVPINQFGHAATVFAYDPTNSRFLVYDNNFPAETVFLQWDIVNGFGTYSKYNGVADNFAFDAMHSSFSPATFESFYQGVESGWASSKYAKITLSEPSNNPKAGIYLVTSDANVLVEGNVNRIAGENLVQRYAHVYINGVYGGSVSVSSAGDFAFTITKLPDSTGTAVMILVSEDSQRWTRGYRAFSQVTIKLEDSFFFKNMGFETGDFSEWDSERHLTYDPTQLIPSDKSGIAYPGYDPIATDLPMVLYGQYSGRVNNYDPNYHVSSVTQDAIVPNATNPVVNFSWAAVLEDPQHLPEEQPYVDITLTDTTAGTVLYKQRYFSNDPSYSGWQSYSGGYWKAIPWQIVQIPVSNAIGHDLVLKVEAADCTLGGHGGYVYLDAEE